MRWMPAAALIAFAALALPATAQIHKCQDASGKTIYSDAPCAAGQSGGLFERQRTQSEIDQERMQAAEAIERQHRDQAARQEAQLLEQQQQRQALPAGGQAAMQDKSSSRECKDATKELEFVSSIRTVTQDEKRMRTNAAIARVNASCGSNTQLMQEPPAVFVEPSRHPANITHCNAGLCYDNQGGVYNRSGNFMTGPNGRTCHRAGTTWNCN